MGQEKARATRLGAIVFLTSVVSVISVAPFDPSSSSNSPVRAVVLGVTQDGGVPHIGCTQELCVAARKDPSRRQRVACLGLVDERAGRRFLIDATPDLASQIESLNAGRAVPDRFRPVDGILLTHAHVGHYAGLMYLGREALGAKGVPVYATARMARFLRENGPWSLLVSLGNIELREIEPGREIALTPDLKATPLRVPHRDELSDTVGFRVRGPGRSLLYVPDVDGWETWDRSLEEEVAGVDVALLDGTFHQADEVPGRALSRIAHPLVGETVGRLRARSPVLPGKVLFIHLNHTNRLLWDPEARGTLAGAGVARDGQELML